MQNMVHQDIPALVIDDISKIYVQWQRSGKMKDIIKNLFSPEKREIKALDRLSFKVAKGEFLAYAGANGAGKSTTIKILSGILHPSKGNIYVMGMNPSKERIELMKNIGVLFGQRTELWWDHPVITSYEWKKSVWNIPQDIFEENLKMVTELLDLSDILKTFARELSLGQRMRADLGMLLLHNPKIIFLDEPTLGLDVLAKKKMINFLKKLNREKGITIVVTSHDMDDLEEMAERIILLSKGQIAFDGNFEELRKVQNNSSRLIITSSGEAPILDNMEFIGSEDGKHSYKFDKEKIKINEIFGTLSNYSEIADIEIIKAPIEDIIADLYNSWKK